MSLSIYHVVDEDAEGYDVFTDWVVVAVSRKQALAINPNTMHEINPKARKPWSETASAEFIGTAGVMFHKPEVICASFNAG